MLRSVAQRIVDRFMNGADIAKGILEEAAKALGISVDDLEEARCVVRPGRSRSVRTIPVPVGGRSGWHR